MEVEGLRGRGAITTPAATLIMMQANMSQTVQVVSREHSSRRT